MTSTMVQLGDGPIGLLAKISVILACTAIVTMVLFRASAALRHAVWFGGLAAALGLAIAWPFAPRLDVQLLPASRPTTVTRTIATAPVATAVYTSEVRSTATTVRAWPPRAVKRSVT